MMGNMEDHFRTIDYAKNLLFNATTEEQEKRARNIIEKEKELEKNIYIKNVLSKT